MSTPSRLNLPFLSVALLALTSACSSPGPDVAHAAPARTDGSVYTVNDTIINATVEASGTAAPIRQAMLSTKLMGTVTSVFVKEGDRVSDGQALVQLDARDLVAREHQLAASTTDAEAQLRDATRQAARIRALFADSAATRAQLDGAETGLARAEAGLRAARAASEELVATRSYAMIRAPFSGVVVKRHVDPGAFAAPGAPLVTVLDASQLRITASATPEAASHIRRGQLLAASIEGRTVEATVEGVVPSAAGNLYAINALVANTSGSIMPGSAAVLFLPAGTRHALVVPSAAIIRQGDLTGVTVRGDAGDQLRWVRLGRAVGTLVEVNTGVRAGDRVVVASRAAAGS